MKKILAAVGTGLAVGAVVATFEAVKNKRSGTVEWASAVKAGVTDTSTLAAAAAGVVAGLFLG